LSLAVRALARQTGLALGVLLSWSSCSCAGRFGAGCCGCGVLVAGVWCLGGRGVFVNWIVDASI